MSCDIHSFAEVKKDGKWQKVGKHFSFREYGKESCNKEKTENPFYWQSYSLFAFLAGVRNYDHCDPISEPRGLPKNLSTGVKQQYKRWECDSHSTSYLTAKELLEYDYDKTFWNRRVSKIEGNWINGAAIAEKGEGIIVTYRENLGERFFEHLEELKILGESENVRIVFWFDN